MRVGKKVKKKLSPLAASSETERRPLKNERYGTLFYQTKCLRNVGY